MKRFIAYLRNAVLPVWVGFNVLTAGITVFSGYAGYIDQEYMPFAGIVSLTFPAWYMLSVVLAIADLLLCRRCAVAPVAAIIIALKPFLVFSPINLGSGEVSADEQERAFSILSYNVVSFVDEQGLSTPDFNRTMHEVLASGADAVVLLEYENQGALKKFVPKSQIDSLNTIYPYFSRGGRGTVLFSKRPILHITPPENLHSKGSIEAFRTNAAGRPVNIFAVHLESIGLDDSDKALYRELTDKKMIDDSEVSVNEIRARLVEKLCNAFRKRSMQAKMLSSYVNQLGGDAIVCGDFNDVPGCRAIHILEKESGMKDAYAKTASGPCITFNAPHFRFRIDHVLWRGNFKAKSIKRGDVASSDHYPMLTTFVWNADDKPARQRGTND